jgi:hypothetical protein
MAWYLVKHRNNSYGSLLAEYLIFFEEYTAVNFRKNQIQNGWLVGWLVGWFGEINL